MNEKKKMRMFLLIAFGVPALLSIFMWIAHRRGLDAGAFPLAWMFLPAAAAMAAKKRFETPEQPFPSAFYWTYLAITGAMILSSVASAFVASRVWEILTNALMIAGGIVILIEILAMGKKKRAAIGLSFGKNAGKTGLGALLFVVLYALGFALNVLLTMWIKGVRWSEISQTFSFYPLGVISLLLSLPLSYLAFFGEEYGWRGFFQPALQEKYGLRKGVVLLGVLWGLWHLPLNFLYYSPETGFFSLLVQIAACIGLGIFFGWLYRKTGNLGSVVLLHFLQNNLGYALFGTMPVDVVWEFKDVLIAVLVYLAVYLPFLLTKEYRQPQRETTAA
ncbi:MAG: CPBP family intramembrane metalloprotease [Clostridia bacterium]|nr:CPBP family intramembrane metalloprotease [Clostridia bacterium]